jgi:hypothetical protein
MKAETESGKSVASSRRLSDCMGAMRKEGAEVETEGVSFA